ncbi:uncharacterized protein LOC114523325 isoform X2 [Dendronephthya gigantea]|uniref:uncharacterized protein LOC114523325 isoform X2 n=1 Tax=Dendronephthya gigantea TaxID=151771 RepID=UPI00106B7A7A|nr:uncharacterized protein LOC114523325 isoform X2 [Dendronephthya gigantea]
MADCAQCSFDDFDLDLLRRANSQVEPQLQSTPKPDGHKTVEVFAQERPQPSKTSQVELEKTNSKTTTLPGALQSNHLSRQAAVALPPVQRQPIRKKTYSKKLFLTPENWERQVPRQLGSITKSDRRVTVFAVVKNFTPPKQSRGTDWYCRFELVDQTLYGNDSYLRCMCFQQSARHIPLILEVGDIIKLPIRIKLYKGCIQGQTYDDHSPWMTFDGQPDQPVVPRYSPSSKPIFTRADKKKVEELRSWAVSVGIADSKKYVTVSSLTEDLYFDYICQVIHVDSTDNVLHVWDGTEPSFNGLLSDRCNAFVETTKWGRKIIGRCVKIHIFGCDLESTCKNGQYILIHGLHFFLKDYRQDDVVEKVPFLALHDRMLSKGGVKILNDDEEDVVKILERRMKALPASPTPESNDSPNVAVTNQKHPDAGTAPPKGRHLPDRGKAEGGNSKKTEIDDREAKATVQKIETTANGKSRVVRPGASKRVIVKNIVIETTPLPASIPHVEQTKVSCANGSNISNSAKIKCSNNKSRSPLAGVSRDLGGNQALESRADKSDGPYQGKINETVPNETREQISNDASADSSVKGTVLGLKVRLADILGNACTNPTTKSCTVIKTFLITPEAQSVDVPSGVSKQTTQSHADVSPHIVDQTCLSVANQAVLKRKFRVESPEGTNQTKRLRIEDSLRTEITFANRLFKIRDIKDGSVPVKFCCSATVSFVMPDEPKRFVKYVCVSCQKRYEVRDVVNIVDNPDFSATVKCINPNCTASLSLIIEFSLILRDETSFVDAISSPLVVRKMFPDVVDPPKLLTDENVQTIVSRILKFLILKEYRIVFEIERFLRPDGKSVCVLTNLAHVLEPGKTTTSSGEETMES